VLEGEGDHPVIPPVVTSIQFDIDRRQQGLGGHRLLLFREGDEGLEELALVKKGWRRSRRQFSEAGAPVPVTVVVCGSKRLPASTLEQCAGFAMWERGAVTCVVHRCEPGGIPREGEEFVWRFRSEGVVDEAYVPDDAPVLVDDEGEPILFVE
jgi:hypothetical protein